MQQDHPRLTVELVPRTAWWSNVRSNVSRSEWEKCKRYAKAKSTLDGQPVCAICSGSGLEQGRKYPVEAHEIWHYDDDRQIQTLVDIIPLCPRCHQCTHLGRTRETSNPRQWAEVIEHLQEVNGWPDWKVERYVLLMFKIWEVRSQMQWSLDVSFLERIGIPLAGRQLERQH
jgi:hypothetical protein